MKTRILATLLLLAATTACSGATKTETPKLSANDAAAIHSLSSGFAAGNGTFSVDETQAECVASGLVTRIGTQQLQSYGILDPDLLATGTLGDTALSQADAEIVADVIFGCVGSDAMFQAIQEGETTLSPKAVRCLSKKLDDDALKQLLVIVLSQDQDVAGWGPEILDPLTGCLGSV